MQYTIKFINIKDNTILKEDDYLNEILKLAPTAKIGDINVLNKDEAIITFNDLDIVEQLFNYSNFQLCKPVKPRWLTANNSLFIYNLRPHITNKGYQSIKDNINSNNNVICNYVFVINNHNNKHLKLIMNSSKDTDKILDKGLSLYGLQIPANKIRRESVAKPNIKTKPTIQNATTTNRDLDFNDRFRIVEKYAIMKAETNNNPELLLSTINNFLSNNNLNTINVNSTPNLSTINNENIDILPTQEFIEAIRYNNLDEQINNLQLKHHEVMKENEKLREQNKILVAELEERNLIITELKEQMTVHKTKIENNKEINDNLNKEFENLAKDHDELVQISKTLNKKNDSLAKELNKYKTDKKKNESTASQTEYNDLTERKNKELISQLANLNLEITNLKQTNDKLNKNINYLKAIKPAEQMTTSSDNSESEDNLPYSNCVNPNLPYSPNSQYFKYNVQSFLHSPNQETSIQKREKTKRKKK